MDFLSLDSRQVISEFLGFLASERLLWQVIGSVAAENGVVLKGVDESRYEFDYGYDSIVWFREFLLEKYADASYQDCVDFVRELFTWSDSIGGHTYWHSVHLKWVSIFRMFYPAVIYDHRRR